ncbi:hypothetical protein ASPZODRAFT_17442 [Penicilliopsis zonata CBS 506.65]|uniref:FAD-binding domain-containing protein n=1 Tax=Penicilliopsis zonata CBS 506.65 TaxID=1073090 RepID=A0A1L9SDC6_9EURO|nr:hypothetical protein ASPZODRAFT_17442 [Penicilliopsis zonata CBS 506.65]OJJ45225.1 hypothetical protein ASPZODRAFT_17442 [Penicilliopsis zonata CBS 506.65]
MKILIVGAGIAGTSLAFFLSQHEVTVIERASHLRASGLQIDLRGAGIKVLKKMGLEDAFREKAVPEQGIALEDSRGRRWGYFPANRAKKGLQSFTTDYEIMRGDFCQLLYDQTRHQARYLFGVAVDSLSQTEGGKVTVLFSNGQADVFDLVVGADGLHSRTRRMISLDGFHPLGMYAGYFTFKQDMVKNKEDYVATAFLAHQNRFIMTRRHNESTLQAYLICKDNMISCKNENDREKKMDDLTAVFSGAGWRTKRILQGMRESTDFYGESMGFVQADKWSDGRVVLLGDAAYSPSAMTGMGTTCALVGAFVLAGELNLGGVNVETALQEYERKLRPFLDQVQKGLDGMAGRFPSSSFGVGILYCLFALASFFRLDVLARYVLREGVSWELPEYI